MIYDSSLAQKLIFTILKNLGYAGLSRQWNCSWWLKGWAEEEQKTNEESGTWKSDSYKAGL